ncbi:hypothetical protein SAMN05216299_10265 [Nitrosospira sp. Nsp14]|nr:hypothetical protein SAMN05216299_10265 [Nitrosospira sp. Nsp14]
MQTVHPLTSRQILPLKITRLPQLRRPLDRGMKFSADSFVPLLNITPTVSALALKRALEPVYRGGASADLPRIDKNTRSVRERE